MKPGHTLGNRYKIISLLGKGGMGRVYRATDIKLDEEVALKMLEQGIEDKEMMDRFIREIKLARTVTHKNICRIFQLEEMEGKQFISMQYIKGEDLATVLKREKAIPVGRALPIIMDVLEGLKAIHSEGIVHRDLKPANIMIDKKGNSYITDFGIARGGGTEGLTRTGSLIGTPEYMAPEQLRGEEVDERTDIYSLGIMMYQMFSGELPFKADSSISTGLKHLTDEPEPIRNVKPDMPAPLAELVMECMEKSPNKRPASVDELLAKIRKIVPKDEDMATTMLDSGGMETMALDSAKTEAQTSPAAAAQIAASAEEERPKRISLKILIPTIITLIAVFIIAFIFLKPAPKISITDLMLLKSIPVHDNVVTSVDFSPDGTRIITGSWDNTAKVIDLNSWEEKAIFREHSAEISCAGFAPVGNLAATSSWDDLVKIWDVSNGITKLTLSGHEDKVNAVAFSPDGKTLATAGNDNTAKIWSTSSGEELHTLAGHTAFVSCCAFSSEGDYIATGSWDSTAKLWVVEDGASVATFEGHTKIINSVAFSPNGNYLATAGNDRSIKIWNPESAELLKTITGHSDLIWSAQFSPDSRYIISASADKTARLWEIQSGKEIKILMGHQGAVNSAAFSPDGELIASGADDGTVKIWKVLY